MDNYDAKLKLAVGLLIVAVVFVLLSLNSKAATPPAIISYQGKILENGVSVSSSLTMTFELFNTSTGGIPLYATTNIVTPSSGLFSILLGDVGTTPLNPEIFKNNSELYLQVTVGTETLSPRKRIVTVPYAFNAKYLDGYGASITPTNTNYIPVANSDGGFTFSNVTTTGDLNVSGTIRAGQICDKDGNNCYVPSLTTTPISQIVTTTVMFNGNITTGTLAGYVAGNNICNAQLSGSHMCSAEEIIYLIRAKGPNPLFNGLNYAWVSNGPPGYLAPSNDCNGWKSSADNNYGPFWEFATSTGGRGVLSPCDQFKPLACCK